MNRIRLTYAGVIAIVVLGLVFAASLAQEGNAPRSPEDAYVGTVAAPEFPDDLDWLNVENPLTLDGLRGKIVLLDFWTYGCINCIHMIPVFRQLKEKYSDEIVVIGVHSAKFENEGETENIREIVQRYEIDHPVINDKDFLVWRTYGANAWPTVAIIDPRGNVVAAQAGEVPFEAFDRFLSGMIDYYDSLGTDELDRTPLDLALEGASDPGTALLYPGKVLADEVGERLFIADTNHHRVVIADLNTYEVLDTIGTGKRGYADGDFDTAQFDQPQGMAIDGDTLYLADVNNHAIRQIDLNDQTVTTIAGTGNMGRGIVSFDTVVGNPTSFDIRSPWDVELGDNNILYIAMAGTHQIWQIDLDTNELQAAVGNGREAQISTTLANSELAQPSGLHWHEGLLYFADSESSTIRVADFNNNSVEVIAGTTNNSLFEYGDMDGAPGESLLQHALGVVANDDNSLVYIADTYNSNIKIYDVEANEVTTGYGLNGEGYLDGAADVSRFYEPGGLDYADGTLYVADTNNHVIRVIDLGTQTVDTVDFPNPQELVTNRRDVTVLGGNAGDNVEITLEDWQYVAVGDGTIELTLNIPDGYKINPLIDSFVRVRSDSIGVEFGGDMILETSATIDDNVVTIPATFNAGEAVVSLDITLYYCEAENEAFCLIDDSTIHMLVVMQGEGDTISVERNITLPEGIADDL